MACPFAVIAVSSFQVIQRSALITISSMAMIGRSLIGSCAISFIGRRFRLGSPKRTATTTFGLSWEKLKLLKDS